MKDGIKRKQISASVDIRVIGLIEKKAEKDKRSFSELVDMALTKAYPPKKDKNETV